MNTIMFYLIVTGVIVTVTGVGIWIRYRRNNDNYDGLGLLDSSFESETFDDLEEDVENNTVL